MDRRERSRREERETTEERETVEVREIAEQSRDLSRDVMIANKLGYREREAIWRDRMR